MRFLLATTAAGAIAAVTGATAAPAETVISTAVTTPVATGTGGDDIRVTSTGSVKPTSGTAVTINSNHSVTNQGAIAIRGASNATGIAATSGTGGSITNSGSILIDEDFTGTDTDNDGDLDGPFAQGSARYGIRVQPGASIHSIINSGTITIEGNQSAGILAESTLTGALISSGTISVLGNDSFGIKAGDVTGGVQISNGNIAVRGQNAIGVQLGDVGGSLIIQAGVTSSGYRSTTAPADPSKLDADDLLQGGSAVIVAGNVGGGILLDARPADNSTTDTDEDDDGVPDSQESTATITSFGSAPAMVIGSASADIAIGAVPSSTAGHGLVSKGIISGAGVYRGVSATGLSIGGLGGAVTIAGGATVSGTISAIAAEANATAVRIGAEASVPTINVSGTIVASGGGTSTTSSQAISIEAGANVGSITNSGTIRAIRSGTAGTASAIVDKSGTLALIENSGSINVADAEGLGSSATAIDLRANTSGATVRQVAAASGKPAPDITGAILFGTGNDVLQINAGTVTGHVDFGGGSDALAVGAMFRGTLANSSGTAVTVGSGATFDLQNLGSVNLASLTTSAGANLGVTIGEDSHTLYNVLGAASFGDGTKFLVTLDSVGSAAGTYKIVDAASLTGAGSLTSSVVTLPYLFTSSISSDAAAGDVSLTIAMKGSGELGLNDSEKAILDAALDAADADKPVAAVFLSLQDSATLKGTLQQMLPEHAGGAFEAVTKGSRLSARLLGDPRPFTDGGLSFWGQQLAWGTSKSIGSTSSYDLSGWGAVLGLEQSLGAFGSVGLTGSLLYGKDSHNSTELVSNHYEGGVYWRGGIGPLRAYARGSAATVKFDSTRLFSGTVSGAAVDRESDGEWTGRLYSGVAGLSYELRSGRLSLRPIASIEYFKLNEKGYTESGGGAAFDLTVRKRSSDELAANGLLSLGYDLLGLQPDDPWMRLELEGGRRELLGGSLGPTVASFGPGDPFELDAEERTSGWRGALRLIGGGPGMSAAAEFGAEELQGEAALGGRVGVQFAM